MHKLIKVLVIFVFLLGLIYTLNNVLAVDVEDNSLTVKSTAIKTVMLQTSTVSCKDTEHSGSGALRARICGQGTSADCGWDDYKLPATNGTCTLEGSGGVDPEVNE